MSAAVTAGASTEAMMGVTFLRTVCRNVAVGSGGDPDAETGARLTCHMLLRLFQMMNTMPTCSSDAKRGSVFVRSSCDRHLLEAAHKRINVGAVVAVLKAILMLGMLACVSHNSSCKVYCSLKFNFNIVHSVSDCDWKT